MDRDGNRRPFESRQTDLALPEKMGVNFVQAIRESLLCSRRREAELAGSALLR